MLSAEDISVLFEKFRIELHCVKRIPMPVFEIAIKLIPECLRNDNTFEEFLKCYFLYVFTSIGRSFPPHLKIILESHMKPANFSVGSLRLTNMT